MFVDSVRISLRAGSGGNGVVAWRREKFIPKGGPVGGNGGKGGSIILQADTHVLSLEGLTNRRLIAAENGHPGGGNLQQGRNGKDQIISVPVGTLVKDALTQEVLFDFTEKGQQWRACQGGRGGKGNHCFKSPTHQAPNVWTPGTPGEQKEIELELKLIADVGLVGIPNAGKSTLMSQITRVPVKIGAYPFTTLYPNLSYVQLPDFSRILVADIPGIIQDAHEDRGLGLAFLKHIERSFALIYVIDISGIEGRDPFEDFRILEEELRAYDPELAKKPFLVALNKMDTEEAQPQADAFIKRYPYPLDTLFPISAANNQGLDVLIDAMRVLVQAHGKRF